MTIEEYFKNSKIRDKNNNLLICYHGSKNKFTEFDPNKADKGGSLGVGFYFSSSEDVSKYYAEEGQVEKYYLNVTNPYYFKKEGSNQMILLKLANELNIKPSDIIAANKQGITGNQFITDKLIEAGYDGVVAEDKDGTLEIVCFKPNQIKSITNQNPTSSNKVNENMKSFTLKDLAKKYNKINKKKNYRGWYEATKGSKQSQGATEIRNAGNVLYNNAFFNQAMGSIDPSVNISGVGTADGGIGMVSSAPAGDVGGGAMGEGLENNSNKININNVVELLKNLNKPYIHQTIDINQPYQAYFVLPEGDFLYGFSNHWALEEILVNNGLSNYPDLKWEDLDSSTLLDLGAVRGNLNDEIGYIQLPKQKLTLQQYEALELILNSLYEDEQDGIEIQDYKGKYNYYGFNDILPEDIIKRIKRYYSSGRLYEELEDSKKYTWDEAYNLILDNFIVTDKPLINRALFILPDGKYLFPRRNNDKKLDDLTPLDIRHTFHDDIDEFIGVYGQIKADDIEPRATGVKILEQKGCIRLNSKSYDNYIRLPSHLPSRDALESLQNILDIWPNNNVPVFAGDEYFQYSLKEYLPEDIIKKIKRFYSSGHLYESILNEFLDQSFEVIHYVSEEGRDYVQEYLDELKEIQPKLFKKTKTNLDLLRQLGAKAREPLSKPISKGLFELRSEAKEGWSRVLYFFIEGKNIILTNGVSKKSNKTPQSAIELAEKLKDDYLRRNK